MALDRVHLPAHSKYILIIELYLPGHGIQIPIICVSSAACFHQTHCGSAHRPKGALGVLLRPRSCSVRFVFDSSMYQDKQRLARGAFAQVFTCQAPSFCLDAPELAVKITDLPTAGDNSISQVMQALSSHVEPCKTLRNPAVPCKFLQNLQFPAGNPVQHCMYPNTTLQNVNLCRETTVCIVILCSLHNASSELHQRAMQRRCSNSA